MDLGVRGRVFVVLGGTRGIGYSAAEVLAEEGARVALIGRDARRAEAAAKELGARTGVATLGVGVAEDSASVEAAFARADRELGPLRGLAAVAGPMGPQGEFHTLDDTAWEAHYQTQLMSAVRACRAALPRLVANGGGTLVTTAAYSVHAQKPTLSAYTAMKSAIASFTKNVAKTYGPRGVRASCVCPGMIETHALAAGREAAEKKYGGDRGDALYLYAEREWGMKLALRRVGKPREVGELIAFLLSERAAYLTGALINIDGGTDF